MVNTHHPDAVHLDQHNARKRKSPPRGDGEGCGTDTLCRAHASPESTRRRLSIDVAAAAAAATVAAAAASASHYYREDSRSLVSTACSSPSSPSSSSSSSSRPSKCLRLTAHSSTMPTSPIEKVKRNYRRKELASRRAMRLLYKRKKRTPYASQLSFASLSYNAPTPLPAHTLSHPITGLSSSVLEPHSSPAVAASMSTPFTPFTSSPPFSCAGSPSNLRTSPAATGSSSSRSCLHQSCVAFRFASMIDGVHLSSLSPPRSLPNSGERVGSFYVPPILPPINRYTLQELDLDAIMKNPQLRHDLLFDVGLQFRPTDSKRKRDMADMYWRTIKSELEAGCSCVSFDNMRHMHRHACHCLTNVCNLGGCVRETNEHVPCEDALPINVPSRVGPLIEELREVITAVVVPPPPPIPVRSGILGTHPSHLVLCPRRLTVPDEASVAWLHDAFDVPLIEQQLRHGVFNPKKLLVAVGTLLREHCAPARDSMITAMLDVADKCEPGKEGRLVDTLAAIRICFELLEYMRLDLANHLLAHLRPHLLASAPTFEAAVFERRLDSNIPVTRSWFSSSYFKISSSSNLHDAVGIILPPPERVQSLSSIQKIVATILPALVDLIVFPPNPTSATLPPSPTTTPVTKGRQTYQVSVQPGYPETLYLDHSRLLMFTADVADITANAMFLALFRQFIFSSPSKDGMRISVSDDGLLQLKKEIAAVGPARPGVCFCREYSLDNDIAESSNLTNWRNAMSSTALHIAHSLENVRSGKSRSLEVDVSESAVRLLPPSAELVESVTRWCRTHMHADSAVSLVFRKKVAVEVLKALIPRFFALWNAGVHPRIGKNQSPFSTGEAPKEDADEGALKIKTGLESLSEEIGILSERLARLAVLHLRVYVPYYIRNGFVDDKK